MLQIDEEAHLFALDIGDGTLMRLQMENERISLSRNDSSAVIEQDLGGAENEWNWNKYSKSVCFVLNTMNGERESLKMNNPKFFPNGLHVYGTTSQIPSASNDIVVYDLKTRKYRNITESIPPLVPESEIPQASAFTHRNLALIGFVGFPESVLVHDGYDIWVVDLETREKPVCITNNYGKKNKLVFKIVLQEGWTTPFNFSDTIILQAFNENNKNEGFFRMVFGTRLDPEAISMKSWKISDFPKRARDAKVYILKAETASASPNFFWTKDFRKYHSLSNNYPEKSYNWITSELFKWRSIDGSFLQGLLFKPENFNPTKRYPVIFHIYESFSGKKNQYNAPQLSYGAINIPWLVSNGFIVCTPDIKYTIGKPGRSAYNAIVSCVQYLDRFPWVDRKRLGLQGHSFGGYEANYLITRSNIFAAVVSASGPTDFISGYNGVVGSGSPSQFIYETHQNRLGGTLWANSQAYFENSPILYANRVSSPLLVMHNRTDRAVPFHHGLEFFLALRRLGKRVWMLQYDDGGHSVYPGTKSPADYTIRMTQFFDHYLKDSACPRWMLYGIPASQKGIETGYELVREKDPKTGKWVTPKEGGLLTDEEKKKVEALKHRKPVTISIE